MGGQRCGSLPASLSRITPKQESPQGVQTLQAPDKALTRLLQLAYSAERAAAFAYRGHAGSVRDPKEKQALADIEAEEWHHRTCVGEIIEGLGLAPSRYYEIKYWVIGQFIGLSCYLIGWFLPNYFAGRLESGNVNEYIDLKERLNRAGHDRWDAVVIEMTEVEKEHEVYFAAAVEGHWMLPLFAAIFRWGPGRSFNSWELSSSESTAAPKSASG